MLKNFITFFIAIFSFSALAETNLSSFKFEDNYGQKVDINYYHQKEQRKAILVNVWATWCKPCIIELPSLVRLQSKMPNITVLPISVDNSKVLANQFLQKRNLLNSGLIFLFDKNAEQLKNIGISSLPTSLLIDNNGKILDVISGAQQWDSRNMLNRIQSKIN